jgi:hypothetical protein
MNRELINAPAVDSSRNGVVDSSSRELEMQTRQAEALRIPELSSQDLALPISLMRPSAADLVTLWHVRGSPTAALPNVTLPFSCAGRRSLTGEEAEGRTGPSQVVGDKIAVIVDCNARRRALAMAPPTGQNDFPAADHRLQLCRATSAWTSPAPPFTTTAIAPLSHVVVEEVTAILGVESVDARSRWRSRPARTIRSATT